VVTATDQLAEQAVDTVQPAYNCMDPGWPRDWNRWHRDTALADRLTPRFAWLNTWYGAPCAFWSVGPAKQVRIGSAKVPPILLLQGRYDAATPLIGARRMHAVLPGSRLLIDDGGNHASYLLSKNPCIDDKAEKYLLTGRLLAAGTCPASS